MHDGRWMRALAAVGWCALGVGVAGCEGAAPAVRAQDHVVTQGAPVVYGDDDRRDFYDVSSPLWRQRTQESVVALMPSSALVPAGAGRFRVRAGTLREELGVCEDERFASQPAAAFCSGTLVDDDLVLTAGHCFDSAADCNGMRFVFGYYLATPGSPVEVTSAEVFRCQEVVLRRLNGTSRPEATQDYALVRLDRSAAPRFRPVPRRPSQDPLRVGEALTLISFGSGLPAKIDQGGRVAFVGRSASATGFGLHVDAFGGSSGGGVFDAAGRLVGSLVGGEEDYVRQGNCLRPNRLPATPSNAFEIASFADVAIADLCLLGYPSGRLCTLDDAWTCSASARGGDDGCDCGCGSWDPDCDLGPSTACAAGRYCRTDLVCADERSSWERPPLPAGLPLFDGTSGEGGGLFCSALHRRPWPPAGVWVVLLALLAGRRRGGSGRRHLNRTSAG